MSVDIAPPPHEDSPLPVKHGRVLLHQLQRVFFIDRCQFRHLIVAIPEIPDGQISLKGPRAVIIKAMRVPIPSVSGIIGRDYMRVLFHHFRINRIPGPIQKSQYQHVEYTPVMRFCISVSKSGQILRDPIPFFLGIGLPDLFFTHPQADHKRRAFYRMLKGSFFLHIPQFLVGQQVQLALRCTGHEDLMPVILPQRQTVEPSLRLLMDQRRRQKKRPAQPFKTLRLYLPLGSSGIGIGFIPFMTLDQHRRLHIRNVLKDTLQIKSARLYPMSARHACIRTFAVIRLFYRICCHCLILSVC